MFGPDSAATPIPELDPSEGRLSVVDERRSRWARPWTAINLLCALFFVFYAYLFWQSVSPYWFHPHWTTDDALQQVYPFHAVHHPEIFDGDLITTMMVQYLTPIHYWISYGVTMLTGDPVMTAHWVMLLQVVLSVGFLFFAVRHAAGLAPAFLASAWLLHTRHLMQRLTGGLPRGWAAPVFTAFLYFALTGKHRGMLGLIFVGCLLHPPATVVAAGAYGMYLLWGYFRPATRTAFAGPLRTFLILSPLYAILALYVVQMPAEIGTMADYETASQMPEFQEPRGRFPFLPLKSVWYEMRTFGFQAFIARFYNPGPFVRRTMPFFVMGLTLAVFAAGLARRRNAIPAQLIFFLIASLGIYFASREVVFKLYVPNRHLQFPLAIFFIAALTIGVWRLLHRGGTERAWRDTSLRRAGFSFAGLLALGALVYVGSGSGLQGSANFNHAFNKRGPVWGWVREHIPETALVAGEPTFIDPVQLFGMRRAYVTTETAHPFYDRYHAEMRRRLEITLRAHYAHSIEDFLALVEPEGIDYFFFDRQKLSGAGLANATYFPPHDTTVKELAAVASDELAVSKIFSTLDWERFNVVPYRDGRVIVVDVAKLRAAFEVK